MVNPQQELQIADCNMTTPHQTRHGQAVRQPYQQLPLQPSLKKGSPGVESFGLPGETAGVVQRDCLVRSASVLQVEDSVGDRESVDSKLPFRAELGVPTRMAEMPFYEGGVNE